MKPRINLKGNLQKYFAKISHSKNNYKKSISTSKNELFNDISALVGIEKEELPSKLAFLVKDLVGSGLWVSYSYVRYLKSIFLLDENKNSFLEDPLHQEIIHCIRSKEEITNSDIKIDDIFNSVFHELSHSILDPEFQTTLEVPKINTTIVLIPGVFNELFKTAAFERGVEFLCQQYGYKYFVPNVSGIHCSATNSHELKEQLENYIQDNPGEKLWIIAYSKGGLDSLHYLSSNQDFATNNIHGISTIASPIIGSQHTEHRALKILNKLSKNPIYKFFDKGRDLVRNEFKKSLSSKYQGMWFRKNYKNLPDSIFYSSIALESNFHESHFWMMIAKIFFPSQGLNDGIVDATDAKFPNYFHSYNFGILNGHHLSGSRSSSFNQEALVLSHLIVLDYLKEFQ